VTITEVNIEPTSPAQARGVVLGVGSIVIDRALRIGDVRVVDLGYRRMVAMPSKRFEVPCPANGCHRSIPVQSRYCLHCGARLPDDLGDGHPAYQDIVHPINSSARHGLEAVVLARFGQVLLDRA
jgi:DNA-binding cell septation regulator SpoVG